MKHSEPDEFSKKFAELFGGEEKLTAAKQKGYVEFTATWNQDRIKIGRVLTAHLVVEYFLTRYLRVTNSDLSSIEDTRPSFSKKIDLLKSDNSLVNSLKPGLKKLNKIRNNIAHNLSVDIAAEDISALLAINRFKKYLEDVYEGMQPPQAPLTILEFFAYYAGGLFQVGATPEGQKWREQQKNKSSTAPE